MISINLMSLLRKGVYLYEYMDDWEKFNETKFPQKEDFCSNLNMKYCRCIRREFGNTLA